MRKSANNYQEEQQMQQMQQMQQILQSHPSGFYHNGTWYSTLGYESQPYTGSLPLPYNQSPQSFPDGAYPTNVESGNAQPYSFAPDNLAQSPSLGRSPPFAQDEQRQQHQEQHIYYYQAYDYQQAQQVYQVPAVHQVSQVQQVLQYQVVPPVAAAPPPPQQQQQSCQQPTQQYTQRIFQQPTQQTPQYQVVPPVAAAPPQQQQQSCQQPTQQYTKRICQQPTQQTPQYQVVPPVAAAPPQQQQQSCQQPTQQYTKRICQQPTQQTPQYQVVPPVAAAPPQQQQQSCQQPTQQYTQRIYQQPTQQTPQYQVVPPVAAAPPQQQQQSCQQPTQQYTKRIFQQPTQQTPQYQVVPPVAAAPPQQQQQSCQQPTQQYTQRIYQQPTQQTPQRAPQMNTFQRYRDEQTPTARSESNALGSNVIEIELTDSCDVYISRAPSKLVINIATPRVHHGYEAPSYVIRASTGNMQNQSENYDRFEHENEFLFAGDTDESYSEDYSNSEESQYLPEQWEESPTYFLQAMKPNLLPQQDFVTELEGQGSGDRKTHENEYDQFRAPRRVIHHNHQPININSLNMSPNVSHEQHYVTTLKETDATHETPSYFNPNNQAAIAMERVEVVKVKPRNLEPLPQTVQIDADIVAPISDKRNTPIIGVYLPEVVVPQHDQQNLEPLPQTVQIDADIVAPISDKRNTPIIGVCLPEVVVPQHDQQNLEPLPQTVQINADIVAPISDKRNTPIIGVCLPEVVVPQHDQQTLIISNDLVLDAYSLSNSTKCEQESLENVSKNAENVVHNTESSNVLSKDLKTIEFEPIEVLNVIEIPQRANIESELDKSVFKETPCFIKTETTRTLPKTNLKSVKSKKRVPKCETMGPKDCLKSCNVVEIPKEDKAKLSKGVKETPCVIKTETTRTLPKTNLKSVKSKKRVPKCKTMGPKDCLKSCNVVEIPKEDKARAQSAKVIQPICYKIHNISPEVDQLVVPSTSDQENVKIGNTNKRREVKSSENDLCKQSKVIPETINNVALKANGSKLAVPKCETMGPKDCLKSCNVVEIPKDDEAKLSKGVIKEDKTLARAQSAKVIQPTCYKIHNISPEVDQLVVPSTSDHENVKIGNTHKRREVKSSENDLCKQSKVIPETINNVALKANGSKLAVPKCETMGPKDCLKSSNVVKIPKEDEAKLSKDINKEDKTLARAQSEKVIQPICYKIHNISSPEVDQLVVPSTSDEENVKIGNTNKRREVKSSENDLCKQSKVISETINNVALKTNGSKLAGHSVIQPICYKIHNLSSPEVDQLVVPSTSDEENVKIGNTNKRREVKSSENDLCKQSKVISETINNVALKANGSKLAGHSNAERTETRPIDVLPKKSPKNSPKGKKSEACQTKSEKVNEPTCHKIQNIPTLEVEQPVATGDVAKVVPKSNAKRKKNKKNNFIDSMPVESEPVQAFGCQQPNSVKKGAKKLSKLERKALRQVKQSLKEAQLKEQAKLSEIPQEEEAEGEQEQQQAESESAQADEPVQAASKEENAHAVLNNLSDVRLRCSLMRIIDKINDM